MNLTCSMEKIFRSTFPEVIPNYELREQQIEIAMRVERALLHEDHLLAEAGTGTGKSFAYLVPLAPYLAQNGGRAVISTATIALQEQLAAKDIPFLESVLEHDFQAQLAKGKGNYLCLLRFEEEPLQISLFQDGRLFARLKDWVGMTQTGDRSELPFEPGDVWDRISPDDTCPGRKCVYYKDCFYVRARNRLKDARVIICNHALFFADLSLRDCCDGQVSLFPEYRIVIFDEAQHVEKTARKAMGAEVSSMRLPVLLYQLRKREGCNLEAVQKALALNDQFFARVMTGNGIGAGNFLLPDDPEIADLGTDLQKTVEEVIDLFDEDCVSEREGALFDCLYRYNGDLREILVGGDANIVYWVEKSRSSRRLLVTLHATPLDVSGSLTRLLFENETLTSVIMTSATLSICGDFSFLKTAVGCSAAQEISVASPFDFQEQCLLYLPQGLPDPRAADFYAQVTPFIKEILRKTKGRAFVLFTSYKGMNEVYDCLADQLPWKLLKQGSLPKQKLLEAFKEDLHSVLFATASYWEGVDVQGEALSCVILVKLPFAVPDDPIIEAKIGAIERAGGNAFYSYSLPEAVIRLKQGFGRLIRTRQDRGIVAILDPRVKTKRYGRYFLDALPPCREVSSLDDVEF